MTTAAAKKQPTKTEQTIRRLYLAVDKVIRAADETRQVRDELVRLATKQKREVRTND
jgi:hypothetical protein